MANAVKWEAVWTSRSTVLTTELNSLANAARSAVGTEIDNGTNLDQYGKVEIVLGSLASVAGGTLTLYMVTAPGGTNYEDGSATVDPGAHTIVAVMGVNAATAAKRIMSPVFPMQPGKSKFILRQDLGVAFAATGNTVTLYTSNDELQ